jgi:hypothetical protein
MKKKLPLSFKSFSYNIKGLIDKFLNELRIPETKFGSLLTNPELVYTPCFLSSNNIELFGLANCLMGFIYWYTSS